ncbi:MAG: hypothetical protein QM775_30845 [Pirellulales bacterium]
MEVAVSVAELTDAELYALDQLLRRVAHRERSASALRLAIALRKEKHWRALNALVDLAEIGA